MTDPDSSSWDNHAILSVDLLLNYLKRSYGNYYFHIFGNFWGHFSVALFLSISLPVSTIYDKFWRYLCYLKWKECFPSFSYLALLKFDYQITLYIKNIEDFTLQSLNHWRFYFFEEKLSHWFFKIPTVIFIF